MVKYIRILKQVQAKAAIKELSRYKEEKNESEKNILKVGL